MWYKAANSDSIKPEVVDLTSSENIVYVRKDFTFIPEKTEGEQTTPAHWEYMERQISKEDFDIYVDLQTTRANLDYVAMMTDVDLPTA